MEFDQKRFEIEYQELKNKYQDKSFLNKDQTLREVRRSSSTARRRKEMNEKYDIPIPTYFKKFQRAGKPYCTYQYSLYEIAMFKVSREYYWEYVKKLRIGLK